MSTSFVIDSIDDEILSDVRYVEEDTFVCTYVKNNNLYALKTDDAGAIWVDYISKQINENNTIS